MDLTTIIIPGVISIIIVILFNGAKRIILKFGQNKLTIDSATNTKSKIIDYVKETCSIEMYRRPTEQKMYMDDNVNKMIRIILAHHVKLLEKHGITQDYFSHPQYKAYSHIVEIALTEMKNNSERRFNYMNEHFSENRREEFNQFTANTAMEFIGAVGEIVQEGWINLGITKEENFEWTRQLVPQISEMIVDIYNYAFSIQIKYAKKIEELKGMINEIIKE